MENGLFSGDRIRQLLLEVAESMKPGRSQSTVLIVGGSLLALRGLRMATQDVDSSMRLDSDLRNAVESVAKKYELAIDWLNDIAVPWHPQTLQLEDCDVLIEHPQLKVLGAPLHAVFLMKLNRSQPQDVLDIITMWPLVTSAFPTARAVIDAYYSAFPFEEQDEFLESEVVDLAKRAGIDLPVE